MICIIHKIFIIIITTTTTTIIIIIIIIIIINIVFIIAICYYYYTSLTIEIMTKNACNNITLIVGRGLIVMSFQALLTPFRTGGMQKGPPYQLFPCNFYERRN